MIKLTKNVQFEAEEFLKGQIETNPDIQQIPYRRVGVFVRKDSEEHQKRIKENLFFLGSVKLNKVIFLLYEA